MVTPTTKGKRPYPSAEQRAKGSIRSMEQILADLPEESVLARSAYIRALRRTREDLARIREGAEA